MITENAWHLDSVLHPGCDFNILCVQAFFSTTSAPLFISKEKEENGVAEAWMGNGGGEGLLIVGWV